jgi:hypothetical protein
MHNTSGARNERQPGCRDGVITDGASFWLELALSRWRATSLHLAEDGVP